MPLMKENNFENFLRTKGFRVTAERMKLIEGIRRQRGHFNVDVLTSRFKKIGFRVSRDTIYRNIPILLEAGVIEQSFKTSRDTFYESVKQKKHHDHLMCRACDRVIEFSDPMIEKLQKKIAAKYDFKIEFHNHQLIGLCRKCRK